MRRKFLGNDHPYVVSSLDSLTRALLSEGKFSEAEEVLRDQLATSHKTNSSDSAFYLHRLAIALLGQDKQAEAEEARQKALAFWKSAALKWAESTDAWPLNRAAWFLATCDEADWRNGPQAVQLAEQAAQRTDRKNAVILDTLAAAYAEVGQFAQAVRTQKEALGLAHPISYTADFAARLKLYSAGKPYREFGSPTQAAASLANGVSYLLKHGQAVEAETPARVCLAIVERESPDDWETFNARSLMGGCLLGQRKYAEAEPLLLSGYEAMKAREDKMPEVGKPRIKEALTRLVQLYEAWGKPDKAAEWKQRLAGSEKATALAKP